MDVEINLKAQVHLYSMMIVEIPLSGPIYQSHVLFMLIWKFEFLMWIGLSVVMMDALPYPQA